MHSFLLHLSLEIIKAKGLDNISIEDLINEISPYAKGIHGLFIFFRNRIY